MDKNIKKRYGGSKIIWHPDKLKSFVEGKVTAPIHVRLKPTNKCNHHCAFCSYDPDTGDLDVRDEMYDRGDEMSREQLLQLVSDFYLQG